MKTILTGYLVGPVWWPHDSECFVPLTVDLERARARFTQKPDLRDLLNHVLMENGGDFQHCAIAQGEIHVSFTKAQGRNVTKRTRAVRLDDLPSAKDFVHSDPDWFPA